jgi:hypothetical protein
MDRTTPLAPPSTSANTNPKIENVVQTVHKVVDVVADKTTAQLDRLSGTAHRAVDRTAAAAAQAAVWASKFPDQATQARAVQRSCVHNDPYSSAFDGGGCIHPRLCPGQDRPLASVEGRIIRE